MKRIYLLAVVGAGLLFGGCKARKVRFVTIGTGGVAEVDRAISGGGEVGTRLAGQAEEMEAEKELQVLILRGRVR
jgi:hypothetical protein